ncbi:hypothetical protein D3C81_1707110 [compost metagenome]
MQTIYFEDQGQDFLEWDIDRNGVVVDSRPFQAEVWCGAVVQSLAVGSPPTVRGPRIATTHTLKYSVERIQNRLPPSVEFNLRRNGDGYTASCRGQSASCTWSREVCAKRLGQKLFPDAVLWIECIDDKSEGTRDSRWRVTVRGH